MLFQMCYGPEIAEIYERIRRFPGQNVRSLKEHFQYNEAGDVTSLIDCTLTVLEDLQFIVNKENQYYTTEDRNWSNKEVFCRLRKIGGPTEQEESLDYIFASLFEHLFVKPDKMFVTNIHYHVNSKFTKTLVGHEKINAWKRMMECWGLGRRLYSGFYGLPHQSLVRDIISGVEKWEGGLQPFCEEVVHPILPCLTFEGKIYRGVIFGLMSLHQTKTVHLSFKQDLPYKSYGPKNEFNWIKIEGGVDAYDTLFK